MILKGGYIIEELLEYIEEADKKAEALCLAKMLSNFDLASNNLSVGIDRGSENKYTDEITIAINFIKRGKPTRLPIKAIQLFQSVYPEQVNIKSHNGRIAVEVCAPPKEFREISVWDFWHIINPDFNRHDHKNIELGSIYEAEFLYTKLPELFFDGKGDFLIQLLEAQYPLSSITANLTAESSSTPLTDRYRFTDQSVDFALEFPYFIDDSHKHGLVIEIDGTQHGNRVQSELDHARDQAIANADWHRPIRISTKELSRLSSSREVAQLYRLFNTPYFQTIAKNYENRLHCNSDIRSYCELSLVPFGVARIQRSILEFLVQGKLSLDAESWKVCIIERDLPCGYLGIADLSELFNSLFQLRKADTTFPEIDLDICSVGCFQDSPLHELYPIAYSSIEEVPADQHYDLVLDISILQRTNFTQAPSLSATNIATIRSLCYLSQADDNLVTGNTIAYPRVATKADGDSWEENEELVKQLYYFLQSAFRVEKFRQGQVPILSKALAARSVIGLLPTGGGKSLTYQLSALLQPGVCLVIDPIKSLMKDQVDGLKRNWIDYSEYLNSSIKGKKRKKVLSDIVEGKAKFMFISPERLQMESFRELLRKMARSGIYFSYCVIDEAHCVSEWGHDFRTAYLRLGENAIKFCKTKNLPSVPLFGLTATASFDVLADVQRELSGRQEQYRLDEDAIVRFETSKRAELQYKIQNISIPKDSNSFKSYWDIRKAVSASKKEAIVKILQEVRSDLLQLQSNAALVFDTEEEKQQYFDAVKLDNIERGSFLRNGANAGIIFTPHAKGAFGVTDRFKQDKEGNRVSSFNGIADAVEESFPSIKVGAFMGASSESDELNDEIEQSAIQNQERFINNEIDVLVATKAFGMGIDKDNVRFTIHVNYPSSIESFVQESGRAGRDRKMAICYLLFNQQELLVQGSNQKYELDLEHNLYFHQNSFRGVEKEMTLLHELLTEVHFPDKTFALERYIEANLQVELKVNYWAKKDMKRLYVQKNRQEKLGYYDLISNKYSTWGSADMYLSKKVFPLIQSYIDKNYHSADGLHEWIQKSESYPGIEALLSNIQEGESFQIEIGFFNNITDRIKIISKWMAKVAQSPLTEKLVRKVRTSATSFTDFIDKIEEEHCKIKGLSRGQFSIKEICKKRDRKRNTPLGTSFDAFQAMYDGCRDKSDTEKAIYRLSTIGVIDDYSVDYNANMFTLYGTKKSEEAYQKNLYAFLTKYYSEKLAKKRLEQLDEVEGEGMIQKGLDFLVHFVYKEIQKKREIAIHDMKDACLVGIESGNVALKTYIDLYFNSKYARSNYSYETEEGEVYASILDDTEEGKYAHWDIVTKYIEVVEEDPKASQIDNIKHLRGACLRILRSQPDNYSLLILNAFTLFMLEYKNTRLVEEAEQYLQNGIYRLSEQENITKDKLIKRCREFISVLEEKNPQLVSYYQFDIEGLLIGLLLKPIKRAREFVARLNQHLTSTI